METAIFIYETGQLNALKGYLFSIPETDRGSFSVIALGADVELVLEEAGITFQSGQGLRSTEHIDFVTYVEKIGREVLDDSTLSFFSYRGVQLTNVFIPILQNYLIFVLYIVDVFATIAETRPQYKRIVVLPSSEPFMETRGVLAALEVSAAVDAARLVAKKHGIEMVVPALENIETPIQRFRTRMGVLSFDLQRMLFGWGLFVLNTFVSDARPRKKIRVLASEYWRHLSPFVPELPEAEVLLLDRAEAFKAGFAAIWKYRMQFIHIDSFVPRSMRKNVSSQTSAFIEQWRQVQNKNTILQDAEFRGISLTPLLAGALQEVIERGGTQAVRTIDGTYALCERMRPDIVLVRASVSAQMHFPILCYVARLLGIPSLEIQHGIFYIGQSSFINRPAAEYVATYGPLASAGLKKVGYTEDRLFNIGSPRFDVYASLHEKKPTWGTNGKPFVVICIVPAVLPQSWSDSYEIVEYFERIAAVVAHMPNVIILFKIRGIAANEDFFRKAIARAFGDIPYRTAQYESIVDVFAESDALIGIYSTTLLEGLISGRPVIYSGLLAMHHSIGQEFIEYAEAGALMKVQTPEELKTALESLSQDPARCAAQVQKADAFMKNNYSFDGGASKHLADKVRFLVGAKAQE